ncbi:MAG: phosphoribosylaminoimidazolesuccinocarboxamide synthase [Planctomycetota bacterium]|nr:MAG: phosphoribosylaminoimidazolesuccinocarboxamide synthase [Planctomycetota bacterium]
MTTDTETNALETELEGLNRLHQGKVRDIYAVDDEHLLLVATDRVSAFDVILPQRLDGKGKVLTSLSEFWFEQTNELVQNHLVETDVTKMGPEIAQHADVLAGRSMLVHRCQPLKAEFVVRGYLAGSGWADYQATGAVCGHPLPAGLEQCQKLPEVLLTPATKAPTGEHDENITIPQLAHVIGPQLASKAGALALALYEHAAEMALQRGLILADTKLEFGLHHDRLMLIDEAFTPDSSRYWSAENFEAGRTQDSFDKQIVRDALVDTDWNREAPAPTLPAEVLEKTHARYLELHRLLTGGEPS